MDLLRGSTRSRCCCHLLLLLLLGHCTLAQLWAVASPSWSLALWAPNFDPSEHRLLCVVAPGLSPRQRNICLQRPNHVAHVAEGARLALAECRHQFRAKRWNCSTPDPASPQQGGGGGPGTREAAFVWAVTAAGLVHAVARACRHGALPGSCSWVVPGSTQQQQQQLPRHGARRGGAADDVEYGYRFAKWFVDTRRQPRGGGGGGESVAKLGQMNQHNTEAGRLAVYNLAHVACRCHGLHGTCTLKTCWQQLADFRQVGDLLKEKYERSSAMRLVSHDSSSDGPGGGGRGEAGGSGGDARRSRRRLEPVNEWLVAPTPSDLVHVSASPDYCEGGGTAGGGPCNVTSRGGRGGGCSLTCCDRGYDTSQVTVETQCGCKEQLQRNVQCKLCPWTVDQFYCK
ncbi:protein Wnt-5b-like isoform X2 [Lethenteron reissneri]|uniref:protein Wnt-5b-like isoform X2 n=1 Tax=Lethenteron reissneri TaxID=7753 RepID=UPI002AB68E01|nr:protein Wnt-5b-like isoform X2 [Lethenteron reissneri]